MSVTAILAIISAIVGVVETDVLPIFIHNPSSQAIEAIIMTDTNTALKVASALTNPTTTTATK